MITLRRLTTSSKVRNFSTVGITGALISSFLAGKASLARVQASYYYDPSDDSLTVKHRLQNMQFASLLLRAHAQDKFLKTNKKDRFEDLLNEIQHDKNNLVQAYHKERRKRQRAVFYSWLALGLSASSIPFLPYESAVLRPLALSTASVLATSEVGHLGGKALGGMLGGISPRNSYIAFGAATAAIIGIVISPFSIAASVFSMGSNVFLQQALIYTQITSAVTVYGLYYIPMLSKQAGVIPTGIEKATDTTAGSFSIARGYSTLVTHIKDVVKVIRFNNIRALKWLEKVRENGLRGYRYTLFSDYHVGRIRDDTVIDSIREQLLELPGVQQYLDQVFTTKETDQQIDVLVQDNATETLNEKSIVYSSSYALKAWISTVGEKIGSTSNGLDVWGFIGVNGKEPGQRGYLLFNSTVDEIAQITREDVKDVKFDQIFTQHDPSKNMEVVIAREIPKGAKTLRSDMILSGGRKVYWVRGTECGVSGWKPANNNQTFNSVYYLPANVAEAGVLDRQDTGSYAVYRNLFSTREFFYKQPLAHKLV
jgi:hypothetical protein